MHTIFSKVLNGEPPAARDASVSSSDLSPCDLCGGRDFRLVATRDRRGAELDTVICHDCGLVAHRSIPSEAELADYYRRQYRWDYHGEYLPSAHRVVREWNRGQELLALLRPLVSRRDHVMEIGCGMGCTVSSFDRAGFSASGVEPGEGFRRFAAEKLAVRVQGGTLAQLPLSPVADVVLLVHVLEHLRSPTTSLAHVRALLYEGGRCYIEVPNAGAPHAAPGKMFHFAHIYNFTQDTLGMLAAKSGFRIRRWLSAPSDKNLRVVLERSDNPRWQVVPQSYARALRAVSGTSRLRYFLRWAYFRQRWRTLVGHQRDRILARRRMQRILTRETGEDPGQSRAGRQVFTTRVRREEICRCPDEPARAAHSS